MRRAAPIAAVAALCLAGPAAAEGLAPLPGWDEASASAGCLAMAATVPLYSPEAAERLDDLDAAGAFWAGRLADLAPEPGDQMEYWEAAHEWLSEELADLSDAEANAFLADYRGRCVIEQATLQSAVLWGTADGVRQ